MILCFLQIEYLVCKLFSNGIGNHETMESESDFHAKIDFKPLLDHFKAVQERHKMFRRLKMKELVK